ncbi:hypothetical protein [Jilunia laotingensis]|uniref:hypothetical protein n=1 Tax=Jilunia laotingensis TaxID=2763675 RepID=UPI00223BBEE9|nr:hypothetical protein [Jilunia laotingensis]
MTFHKMALTIFVRNIRLMPHCRTMNSFCPDSKNIFLEVEKIKGHIPKSGYAPFYCKTS